MPVSLSEQPVGVVGCGSIGSRYAKWFGDLGRTVVAYDADPARSLALGEQGVMACTNLDDLLAADCSHILIATPPHRHREAFEAVLTGSKAAILVEKPLAATLEDAKQIATLAASAPDRAIFGVCNMRFHPGVQALKHSLKEVGTPLFARLIFGHRLAQMRPAGTNIFAADTATGGGVILDCVHELDYLQWLFGPLSLHASWTGQIGPDKISAEDFAEIQLVSASGVRIAIHLDFLMRYKRRGCEIAGTEATLAWNSFGRRPEECRISLDRMDAPATLSEIAAVDSAVEYLDMLKDFLAGGANLQRIDEAVNVLALALAARGQA